MGKRQKEVHIYLDNNAWPALKGNEQALQHIKRTGFYPVLSEFNYREACKMILGKNRQEGEELLRFMMHLARGCISHLGDLLSCDMQHTVYGRKVSYFMKEDSNFLSQLKEGAENPSRYIQLFQAVAADTEGFRKHFEESFFDARKSAREAVIQRYGNFSGLNFSDFLTAWVGRLGITMTRQLFERMHIPYPQETASKIVERLHVSKVVSAFLGSWAAMSFEYIVKGRRPRGNDVYDALHYTASAYCEFFITEDRRLRAILSNIDSPTPRVMRLETFLEQNVLCSAP